MLFWHGIPLGIDFRGGTVVVVKFADAPNNNAIRDALDKAGLHNAVIQSYGDSSSNEVIIKLDLKETNESDLDKGKNQIINALETNPVQGKQNINNSDRIGFLQIQDALVAADPLHADPTEYDRLARSVLDFRDKQHGGGIKSRDD